MLSMAAMSSGQAGYYLGLASEDYYLKGGEPPGQWYGRGSQLLGLSGEVQNEELYNLFDGLSPNGADSLIQRQRHEGKAQHRPGWDLTFSAPKSVSVLWSQASPENCLLIQGAHREAVEAALDYLQEASVLTRRGKEGKRLDKTNAVVALFEHSTSRALDPQLHTHALLMNIGVRDDGTTGTLSSLSLFQSKMAAGALYRVHLSGLLEKLGIETEQHRSWFEVSGVSDSLIDTFSKRRKQVEAALQVKGLDSPEAAAVAAIETRDIKDAVSRSELFDGWLLDGSADGWARPEADKLFGMFKPKREKAIELATATLLATEQITQSQAHFTHRDFIRIMAEKAQSTGLLARDVVEGGCEFLTKSDAIVRLGRHHGEDRFTTREMLELEGSLLDCATKLSADHSHVISADALVAAFTQTDNLSEEQLKAVWHVTNSTGAMAVVSGMAGTGKTRMLGAAREVWEAGGFKVIGAAISAMAGEQLTQGANIESGTIARLLIDIENGRSPLDPRTILVIDEAGMVATPELERLARSSQRAGSKLVLIGDERQLQPIGPGAPFMELGMRFGHAELQNIQRQSEAWARRAVKDIADGNASEALEEFIVRGLVKVYDTRDDAMRALVREWRSDGKPLSETLLLAGTRSEVQSLNALAQDERKQAGELGAESIRVDDVTYFVDDRVLFTQNHRAMGVLNGDRGWVKAISEDGRRMTVRLDTGEQVGFDPDAMRDFALGYASTTHKAQGSTSTST